MESKIPAEYWLRTLNPLNWGPWQQAILIFAIIAFALAVRRVRKG